MTKDTRAAERCAISPTCGKGGPSLPLTPLACPPDLRFTVEEAENLYDECSFNCGPSALAAITQRTPREVLEAMPDFKSRGYTNPTMMRRGLAWLGAKWTETLSQDGAVNLTNQASAFPTFGLARLQWAGRWTKPGVPVRARYRYSHWVAACGAWVYDINAMSVGGWLPQPEWANELVPWLLRELYKDKTTGWWTTHSWEIERK